MDDEQKQLKAVSRANKAKATLENESIKDAFSILEKELITRWKSSDTPEGRERLWMATQILEKVKEGLAYAITNGEVAKRILDQIEKDRRKAA